MKRAWSQFGEFWCRHMHPAPMWPVRGRYQCPTCLRAYPVVWERRNKPEQRPAKLAAANATYRDAQAAEMVATLLSR